MDMKQEPPTEAPAEAAASDTLAAADVPMPDITAKKEEPDAAAALRHCPPVGQALTVDNFRHQALEVLEAVLKERLGPRQYLTHHLGDVGSEACKKFAEELSAQYPPQPGGVYYTLPELSSGHAMLQSWCASPT